MIQFYIQDISAVSVLPEVESGHCVRVLRMCQGDEIYCVDGKGHRYRCRITDAHPKHCCVEVIGKEDIPTHWGVNITLCFAPTKNMDRMEWMVEKCTEMGVDRFVPVDCRNSERHVFKTERIRKIIVSAMKQSLKATLPDINELTPLKTVLSNLTNSEGQPWQGGKYICYCSDEVERLEFVKEYSAGKDVAILIGPEGDFTEQEVAFAIQNGWKPVSLGKSRLRTETAAMTAVSNVHCINQINS